MKGSLQPEHVERIGSRIYDRDARFLERLVGTIDGPLKAYFRPVVQGFENIPDGSGLYVGNHNGGTLMPDTFIFGCELFHERPLDDLPYALGHDAVFWNRKVAEFCGKMGVVRASRENARRLFEAGKKVLVYPGGELDSMRSIWKRDQVVFGPRRGYIKLALREAVPIIPVVAAGAQETFWVLSEGRSLARLLQLPKLARIQVLPISFCLPWGITLGPIVYLPFPTRIFIRILEPLYFERQGEGAARDRDYVEECHLQVHHRMQQALTRLADERRAVLAGEK